MIFNELNKKKLKYYDVTEMCCVDLSLPDVTAAAANNDGNAEAERVTCLERL